VCCSHGVPGVVVGPVADVVGVQATKAEIPQVGRRLHVAGVLVHGQLQDVPVARVCRKK
jgi:hypothetical protein